MLVDYYFSQLTLKKYPFKFSIFSKSEKDTGVPLALVFFSINDII